VVARVLRGSWFDCPITLPPDLVVVEPAPLKSISGLVPALARHPVVGRVPWVIVIDRERLHLAAALPCSDFLVRGFVADEARSRIERLLLRRPDPRAVLRSGPVTLDRQLHEARLLDAPMHLTPQEFALLRHFVLNAGKALSRESLLQHVWGAQYQGGVRTVDVHVRRLRAHLGSAAGHLRTVQQVGYCWLE
jgi:DNA-binding response OmpR family regulator